MTGPTESAEDGTAMFACFAHRRRRIVLAYFAETGRTSATVDELADYVRMEESPSPDRKSVTISLHHVHLPKLADDDAIIYDIDRRTVTITDRGAEWLPRLAAIPRSERTETTAE